MDKLDFKTFDKRFDNLPEPVNNNNGMSDIDCKRVEWMKHNIREYQIPQLAMPEIPGLKTHNGRLPVTRNWYRRIASYELNGLLNVWTPALNIKMTYWSFFPFLAYGR